EFRKTRPSPVHELRPAEWNRIALPFREDKHCRFVERRHSHRAPARATFHFGSAGDQQLRPRFRPVRLLLHVSRTEGGHLNSRFNPRFLTAPEYVLALYAPEDFAAILVRNRARQRTMQRIVPAEMIAGQRFQAWLVEQNLAGADIFIGMNPVRSNSKYRTKEHIREIRHVYLDLDEEAGASLHAIRTSGDIPNPNFLLDTPPGKH